MLSPTARASFPLTESSISSVHAIVSVVLAAIISVALLQASQPAFAADTDRLPNIVFILADDLGYGDVSCYNPEAKVQTRHLDKLAADGMRFTDAHSPSTVCTPTRYSLLTGRMAFRTGMRGVFTGAGGPCMIEQQRLTLPQMLRDRGYVTACFGKWHVGLTFLDENGQPINENGREAVTLIDFSRAIPDAPVHRGFDRVLWHCLLSHHRLAVCLHRG